MKTNNTVRKAASGRRAAIRPQRQKEPRNLLFSFAVVALGLVLAVLVIFFFTRLNRTFYSYTSSANDILRQLNRGDYAEAWYEKQMNEGNGVTADKKEDYVVPYAVVDYFEAASYRTAYEKAGNAAAAALWQAKMDAAAAQMGELGYMTEEIDAIFAD